MNSRLQQILQLLLHSSEPVTFSRISEKLRISTRTVQRELEDADVILSDYALNLIKKPGVGLALSGEPEKRQALLQDLNQLQSDKLFTPEERKFLIKQMLLTLKEPTKLFYFSNKLNVTEATVSQDLSKLEPWFGERHIRLIRKPGLGVAVEGEENHIRRAMVDLLYEHYSQEQLMDILSSYSYSFTNKIKLELSIRNQLLQFINPSDIAKIEQAVRRCERKWNYQMTDSDYIGFIVHIALAVQRLKNNENIVMDAENLQSLKKNYEFEWAAEIVGEISEALEIDIPESEIGYITMHILVKTSRTRAGPEEQAAYNVKMLADDLIRIVERELFTTFEYDPILIENLSAHLETAIQRISWNMAVRNPLLSRIKKEYPAIYQASDKACQHLGKQLKCRIPEAEIGFIAMHFGAAAIRKKDAAPAHRRVVIVCTSGMGTSRFLASQIQQELPLLQIAGSVSLLHLDEWLRKNKPVDLILSTVPFEHERYPIVVVNSLLTAEDITAIENRLSSMQDEPGEPADGPKIEEKVSKMTRYGNAIVQILQNIYVIGHPAVKTKSDVLKEAVSYIAARGICDQPKKLKKELIHREKLGTLLLEDKQLSLLHCRSETVKTLCVCVLTLESEIVWDRKKGAKARTVLVLLAPKQVPKESTDLIGEISAALIDEAFVTGLASANSVEIERHIRMVLDMGYTEKIKQMIRGEL